MRFCRLLVPVGVLCFAILPAFAVDTPSSSTTNAPVFDHPPVAPDLIWPVTIATNNGKQVYQFGMQPTVTNMVVASNDLVRLQADLKKIDDQTTVLTATGKALRSDLRNNYRVIVGVMTNFTMVNPEGKKLQERITALEKELKSLQAELQKKLDADTAYKQAKSEIEAKREKFGEMEKQMKELHQKRSDTSAKAWQLQTVMDQVKQAEAAKAKEKEKKTSEAKP